MRLLITVAAFSLFITSSFAFDCTELSKKERAYLESKSEYELRKAERNKQYLTWIDAISEMQDALENQDLNSVNSISEVSIATKKLEKANTEFSKARLYSELAFRRMKLLHGSYLGLKSLCK